MKKKIVCTISIMLISILCFADSLDDAVTKAINKLIPEDDMLIEVETPYYDDTFAASEFSVYLKYTIESAITDSGKNVFDYELNNLTESKIAEYFDSGFSMGTMWRTSDQTMPNGIISSTFSEKNNEVTIFFEYMQLLGSKKTTKVVVSTKNLPGLQYEPKNYELAQGVYMDIKEAELIAKRSPEKTIKITATMLDSDNKPVDTLYPDSIVHFRIVSPEKNAYITVQNITADKKTIWLVQNKLIHAGVPWNSPNFKPEDNVYGQETIYVYAATSPDGLPIPDMESEYIPGMITSATRGLMLDLSDDGIATGTVPLTYTIMER